MPQILPAARESQGENRNRTAVVADYVPAINHLATRHEPFPRVGRGILTIAGRAKSGQGKWRKEQFVKEKNDHPATIIGALRLKSAQFIRFRYFCQYGN